MHIDTSEPTEFPGYGASSADPITKEQFEARVRWVETLRSGKYRQTQHKLATASGKSRCCLGVACDPVVTGVEMDVTINHSYLNNRNQKVMTFDEAVAVLPNRAMDALGFIIAIPDVSYEDSNWVGLASLNDQTRLTFKQIADLVEEEYVTPYYVNDVFPYPHEGEDL